MNAFKKPSNWDRVILLAPAHCGYEEVITPAIDFIPIHSFLLSRIMRPFLERIFIFAIIKRNKVTRVFSMGNLPLPYFCNQSLLFDNPFTTCHDLSRFHFTFYNRIIHEARNFLFRKRIKYVQLFFVQTAIQKQLLESKFSKCPGIVVIPNTYPSTKNKKIVSKKFTIDTNKINLVALTRYYEHKNLEILLKTAELFKIYNRPYKIYLTIEPDQGRRARLLIKNIVRSNLKQHIENLGSIRPFNIEEFYSCFDAVILPSYIESFSTIYAEALKFNKPIFTSDKEFAHTVCGNYAYYFNEDSAESILHKLDEVYADSSRMEQHLERYKIRLPLWEELVKKYIHSIETTKLTE
jgi:glycosyltransferase involved in cell wall biosynthesis